MEKNSGNFEEKNIANYRSVRLRELDSLRCVAVLAVVIYHYTYGYSVDVSAHNSPIPNIRLGQFGVELFFVISGFVISWTLGRSKSLIDFFIGRISRLYPPYIFALILTSLTIFVLNFNPNHIKLLSVLYNIFIGLPQLCGQPNVDPSYWTLGLEISFYAMSSLFTYITRQRFEIFAILWMAMSLSIIYCFPDNFVLRLALVTNYSGVFVAGSMIFFLSNSAELDVFSLLTLLASLALCFIAQGDPAAHMPKAANGLLICIFSGIIYAAATGKMKFMDLNPLVVIGQASYSLYLIHQIIGYFIIFELEKFEVSAAFAIVITIIIITIASISMRNFIEKPAQSVVKKSFKNFFAG